jgi:hypothetical protein
MCQIFPPFSNFTLNLQLGILVLQQQRLLDVSASVRHRNLNKKAAEI